MQLASLCLLAVWCGARAEPLGAALQRRSHLPYAGGYPTYTYDGAYAGGAYAGDGLYAAVPLHPPVPVVHVLSAAPLSPAAAATKLAPLYAAPYRQYDQRYKEYEYAPYKYAPYKYPAYKVAEEYAPDDEYDAYGSPSNSMLYARPDAYGGYTYYRRPAQAPAPPPRKVQRKRKPVIVRIHKYRVVRD